MLKTMRKLKAALLIPVLVSGVMGMTEAARVSRGAWPQDGASRTVWDGVYTAAQVERGREAFNVSCAHCHGADLTGSNGPSLIGDRFMERWREFPAEILFNMLKEGMPPNPRGNTPRLADDAYLDIVTLIMQHNGFPPGERELTFADLSEVMIQYEDGPRLVPSHSLVKAVGCFEQNERNEWILTATANPVRTLTPYEVTEEELAESRLVRLGSATLWLNNVDYLDGFNPAAHLGMKVQVKGQFILQPNRERINVNSIGSTGLAC